MHSRNLLQRVCVCACLLLPAFAFASVVVDTTRLVYPANEREISLRLSNQGRQPALVQNWIDAGDADAKPDEVDVPFVVMPPIARINQGRGQSLRIAYTPGTEVPKDRESVFWLNVLDVPPMPSTQADNHMQMAFRTRLKIFFRPADLHGSAIDAAEKLRWSLIKTANGSVLQVRNDEAFHVSFHSVEVKLKSGAGFKASSHMIAPKSFGEFVFEKTPSPLDADARVIYEWINDYGATVRAEAKLQIQK